MNSVSASKRLWTKGFMWGTGASSTQCEGAAPQSDWHAWERAGNAPISADGNGFASRYAQDFKIFASLGLTHHRLSIEWARIEPQQGSQDQNAIDHYTNILTTAHELEINIWVCLHHFSLPNWFANLGGIWLKKIVKIIGWRMLTSLQKLLVILLQAGNNNGEEWLTVS